jgi:hypothetical protein
MRRTSDSLCVERGMPCPPSGSPCQESTHELQKSAIRPPPSARRQPLWCAGLSSGLLDVDILTLLALETVTIVPTWPYTAPPAHRSVTQQHHHTRPEVGQVTAICTYKLATAAPATAGHSSTAIVSSRHVHTQPSPVFETPVSIGCRQPPAKHPETPLGATPAACAPPPVRNNRPKRSSTTAPSIRTARNSGLCAFRSVKLPSSSSPPPPSSLLFTTPPFFPLHVTRQPCSIPPVLSVAHIFLAGQHPPSLFHPPLKSIPFPPFYAGRKILHNTRCLCLDLAGPSSPQPHYRRLGPCLPTSPEASASLGLALLDLSLLVHSTRPSPPLLLSPLGSRQYISTRPPLKTHTTLLQPCLHQPSPCTTRLPWTTSSPCPSPRT